MLRPIAVSVLTLLLAACRLSPDEAPAAGADAVTNIDDSAVKEQTIGTCWLYTTAAWAEALHLEATGRTVDLSETYWTYWAFYDRIVGGKVDENGFIDESGTWGEAAEIIARYGLVREGDFIPEDANNLHTERAEDALNNILFSLSAGTLKTPASRHDRALVRAELNKAFELHPEVVAWMDETFGKDGTKVLSSSATTVSSGSPIVKPDDFQVTGGPGKMRSLKALIGVDLPNIDPNRRTGLDAWQYAAYPHSDPSSQRNLQKRVQRALNDRLPVVFAWHVDHAAVGADGVLRAPSSKTAATESHLSLITDYQVSNVPGFGTLAVGTQESRPAALQASLADTASLDLLRIKNSWGTSARQHSSIPAGYYDIARNYFDASFDTCNSGTCSSVPAFNYVILPAGY